MISNILQNIADNIIVFGIAAIIIGIVGFVQRKNLKAGNILMFIIGLVSVLFLVFIVLALIVLLLNAKFHFLF